jgi:hypothetical protein
METYGACRKKQSMGRQNRSNKYVYHSHLNLLRSQNPTSHIVIAVQGRNIEIDNLGFIIPPPQSNLLFPKWIILELGDFILTERSSLILE